MESNNPLESIVDMEFIRMFLDTEEENENDTNENVRKDTDDMCPEDRRLRDELETLVKSLKREHRQVFPPSLEKLRQIILDSVNSKTAIPKAIKFMRPHYQSMKRVYRRAPHVTTKQACADIISVLAMMLGDGKECLIYRFISDPRQEIASWGPEYIRHLSIEIAVNWRRKSDRFRRRVVRIVRQVLPYQLAHNAEEDACDMLLDIVQLPLLVDYVDDTTFDRVVSYLVSCYPYSIEPENEVILEVGLNLSRKRKRDPEAMRFALMLNMPKAMDRIFYKCIDPSIRRQLGFMMARQSIYLPLKEDDTDEELSDILTNVNLSSYFLNFVRQLDIMEPKTPEDIYKSHLNTVRVLFFVPHMDSARQNLAASFVNGFVNAGFGTDKLLTVENSKWLQKNIDHGVISATASLGLILLWDVDGGLAAIDKYFYSKDPYIKSGCLLACGILNCRVRNDCEPAHALLSDYLYNQSTSLRVSAILGLGIAYAGTNNEMVIDSLYNIFLNKRTCNEVLSMAGLSLGMIAVGTCNEKVGNMLMRTVLTRRDQHLDDTYVRFLVLGLGLIFLGNQEASDTVVIALELLEKPYNSWASTLIECCAYAGTANLLKMQELLRICKPHYIKKNDEKSRRPRRIFERAVRPDDLSGTQAIAVIGIALIAMKENIGCEMAFRHFGNFMRYCEPCIRRAVPLALGIMSVSNPKWDILDMLNKFARDSDAEVAYNSIFAMGLVGAGTNNARLASILRQLAQFYIKDSTYLFIVRLAQGLVHLGKGTLTLSPYHSDRQIMNKPAVAALLTIVIAFLDVRNLILARSHYLLYMIVPAIHPRMLVTFDENLQEINVPVHVGKAVDVVRKAGHPKRITAFQTFTTPVVLAIGDRAELATDEYISLTPVIEGCVILRKNPDYVKSKF